MRWFIINRKVYISGVCVKDIVMVIQLLVLAVLDRMEYINPLCILITSPHSKYCTAKLSLRTGFKHDT